MTDKKHNTSALEWKALMEGQKDLFKALGAGSGPVSIRSRDAGGRRSCAV